MTHLYFHCTGPNEILIDQNGADIFDLAEAHERAIELARCIVENAYGITDFSEWIVYVSDEDDDEMLLVPFADVLPTLH